MISQAVTVPVRIDAAQHAHVDHGYAVTMHKAQGTTVDRAYLLASGGTDRHLAYVGMTRHREAATLYAGGDEIPGRGGASPAARPKASSLDFAERHGVETQKPFLENARAWLESGRERLAQAWERAERAVAASARGQDRSGRRRCGSSFRRQGRGPTLLPKTRAAAPCGIPSAPARSRDKNQDRR